MKEDFRDLIIIKKKCGKYINISLMLEKKAIDGINRSPNHWTCQRRVSVGHNKCRYKVKHMGEKKKKTKTENTVKSQRAWWKYLMHMKYDS